MTPLDELDPLIAEVARRALDRGESADTRVRVPGSASTGQDTRPAGEPNPLPSPRLPYLLVRTMPAPADLECSGRRCSTVVPEGEPLACVAKLERVRDNPNADDARAWLCSGCVERLGDRLDRPTRCYTRVQVATTTGGGPSW